MVVNFSNFEYFIILLLLLTTTVLLEKKYNVHLYKNRKERIELIVIFFLIGIVWDTFAIWRGHWIFPTEKNMGIIVGLMPLEEYMFIFTIPYTILTIYKLIDSKFRKR